MCYCAAWAHPAAGKMRGFFPCDKLRVRMTRFKIASLRNDSSISIYSSILPSGGKLLCQLFEDIFGVEVVLIVSVDGFVGRTVRAVSVGRAVSGSFDSPSHAQGRSG